MLKTCKILHGSLFPIPKTVGKYLRLTIPTCLSTVSVVVQIFHGVYGFRSTKDLRKKKKKNRQRFREAFDSQIVGLRGLGVIKYSSPRLTSCPCRRTNVATPEMLRSLRWRQWQRNLSRLSGK